MDRLRRLQQAGVAIWLDDLSRDLLETGELARLIQDRHVTGATSNPTIFAKAITASDRYDDDLARLAAQGERDHQELFFALALDDVRQAADLLRPAYERSAGDDGFVSLECTPDVADDTTATVTQAMELWRRLDRPNVMIKVPATPAGVAAVEHLTAAGVNVNVTLLFSVERYAEVQDAYLRGLETRAAAGSSLEPLTSVASFFVSRVDSKVDAHLPGHSPLRGRAAIANAAAAFTMHQEALASGRWGRLAKAGARVQKPLWASTGTKDDAYSDVVYVEALIAPGVVNTMPLATLEAFADHGTTTRTLGHSSRHEQDLHALARADVDLARVTAQLEREGIEAFSASYDQLLACIGDRAAVLGGPPA